MAAFTFPSYSIDFATGEVLFDYALTGPDGDQRFTEVITLPLPAEPVSDATAARLARVLELLHVVAGVSYYKAAAPPRLVLPAPLGSAAVELVTAVYTKGLAEYAYRNALPHVLTLRPEVPAGSVETAAPWDNSDRRPLSAVGGGKDSIVTLEALRRAGLDPVPFSVNPNHVIVSVNEASDLVPLAARRRLDPELFELNRAGARNGHIPVTAINSLIAVATAVLHDLGPVVMSNERSASRPEPGLAGPRDQPPVVQGRRGGRAAAGRAGRARRAHRAVLLAPASPVRAAHRPAVRRDRQVRRGGDELQRRVQAARRERALVPELPEVPLRLPGHGPVHAPRAAHRHLRR